MSKPKNGLDWLKHILAKATLQASDQVVLVGVRGYYRDSMGDKGTNQRGLYDDAFFWLNLKTGFLASYNGNTDPSAYRKGRGTGSKKGMANLKPGTWRYQKGTHRGYEAFTQAAKVTVSRDGFDGSYDDTGYFGINIHRGGTSGTSSLGCQTVPVSQWQDFKDTGYTLLSKARQKTFPYILVEEQG